jgi:hypothetical protein
VLLYVQRLGDFVFQDDNPRPHRARLVHAFLLQHGIQCMKSPACSPDLNSSSVVGAARQGFYGADGSRHYLGTVASDNYRWVGGLPLHRQVLPDSLFAQMNNISSHMQFCVLQNYMHVSQVNIIFPIHWLWNVPPHHFF